MTQLRALTLTQPWATLVAVGVKKIETRSWTSSYRGPLAIHAAAGLGPVGGLVGFAHLVHSDPFFEALRPYLTGDTVRERALSLPRGSIVAVTRLTDVVRTGEAWSIEPDWVERQFGDYTPGRYAWQLERTLRISMPIPCRGALGLWNVPPETRRALEDIIDIRALAYHYVDDNAREDGHAHRG